MLEFNKYLKIDYDYHRMEDEVLLNKNLAKPGQTYKSIFYLL